MSAGQGPATQQRVDEDLVVALSTAATASSTRGRGGVVDVATDPLDGSVWVRMTSWARAREALDGLSAHGLGVVDRRDCRLQVIGWDPRALRRRLAVLLAGVDDLQAEWDATAELVRYHRDRRSQSSGEQPEPVEVLADVERTLRDARPIPHSAPNTADVDSLLQLVEAAEDAYAQLITQHLEHAAGVLAADAAGPGCRPPAAH